MQIFQQITEHLLSRKRVLSSSAVLVIVVIIILVKPAGATVI